MDKDKLSLGSEFPPATEQIWLSMVEKVLKGADFDKTLVTKTYDNLDINPLYSSLEKEPANPGHFPYTRSVSQTGNADAGWQIAQIITHPDVKIANQHILEGLQRGVSRMHLLMPKSMRCGEKDIRLATHSEYGIECYSLDHLEQSLKEVKVELVPLELDAGNAFYEYALALLALYEKREVAVDEIRAGLNADPAAALAEFGVLADSESVMKDRLVQLALLCDRKYPNTRAVAVDTSVYHNAGATHAQEIALALATGVGYLRAMTEAGMSINAACRQIRFFISTDTDYFQCIAKLRSLRQLWSQVCKLSGADATEAKIDLHVKTSTRMLSQRDPWVNMLRVTIASNAAAIGGAESVATTSFDLAATGQSSSLGRRISRNTQLLLQEESSIHKIVDPAGGSWFIESHTSDLSEKAWILFQNLERQDGIFSALLSGFVQKEIEVARNARMDAIAKRKHALTGVSEFANLEEAPLTAPEIDRAGVFDAVRKQNSEHVETTDFRDVDAIIKLLIQGASTASLAVSFSGKSVQSTPLVPVRLASEFEALRDASDAYLLACGKRPSAFMITPGTPAQFNARAGFARNFFAAGGIELATAEIGISADEAASAWKSSQLEVAVLCSADSVYEDIGLDYVKALRAAGAQHIIITGKSLVDESDIQIHLGSNTLEVLRKLHQIMEVK